MHRELITQSPLARLKPAPIPPINPVPERDAQGSLKATYEQTRQLLQVPWMGVVTMAFAHYPRFYDCLWQGLQPLLASAQFTDACQALRGIAEQQASQLQHRALQPTLREKGYSEGELTEIRSMVEVFSHGNYPYLLLATFARLLLEGHSLSSDTTTSPRPESAPPQAPPLVLMEPHHGNDQLQHTYDDIRATLGLPFVNTDYRALARWPGYFDAAWQDLKPRIQSPDYETRVSNTHHAAVNLALSLPNPGQLTGDQLRAAAEEDASADEILAVVRLFQYLLPGLATNVAVFAAQLTPPAPALSDR